MQVVAQTIFIAYTQLNNVLLLLCKTSQLLDIFSYNYLNFKYLWKFICTCERVQLMGLVHDLCSYVKCI